MSEQIAQVPFLEQIAAELQQRGEYSGQLSATAVEKLLSGAVSQLVGERENIRVSLSNLSVKIKESDQWPRDGEVTILGVGTDVKAMISDRIMGTMHQRSISSWLSKEMKKRGAKLNTLSLHLLPESLEIILA